MKSPFCFILSLISIFIINAQETQKNQLNKKNQKTGNWIGYHKETDTRRYNGNFIEGKPVGLFTYYAKEGHVSAKVNFINDSLSSSEMYFDNGYVMAKGKFINQMKQGKWFTYSRTGTLLNIFNFDKGAMEGTQYLYYPADPETNSLKIMEEYNCSNGLKNGIWKQYFKSGRVKSEGNYSMGKRDGVFIYYFANGTIDTKGSFKNDFKEGNWFYYDGEKSNMKKVTYEKGNLIEKKNEE
jgi:antitoxin component YwqK of YwqJK toxin-antitoxin module